MKEVKGGRMSAEGIRANVGKKGSIKSDNMPVDKLNLSG